MTKFKILEKHNVVTAGSGDTRVVLDREAGLIYPEREPQQVVGLFEKGKGWVLASKPYYNRGGWGRGSDGDYLGSNRHSNAVELLNALSAKAFTLNTKSFMTQDEVDAHNNTVDAMKALSKNGALKIDVYAEALPKRIEMTPVTGVSNDYDYNTRKYNRKPLKGFSPLGIDPLETLAKFRTSVETFINAKGKGVTIDGYKIEPNLITQKGVTVAVRTSDKKVILNSQTLEISPFEHSFLGGQSIIQKAVREIADLSIPFNILEAANLKLSETKVIETGPECDVNGRHFTGALFLENSGRKFLMDIDRLEASYGLFNVFFVEVNSNATSIESAYETMKPQEVRDAEMAGIEVKRQGEWFFINTGKTLDVAGRDVHRYGLRESDRKYDLIRGLNRTQIAHGQGRPNTVFQPYGYGSDIDSLVCGNVEHTGREHKSLDLGSEKIDLAEPMLLEADATGTREKVTQVTRYKLFKIVPNTTVGNFTITGDVD